MTIATLQPGLPAPVRRPDRWVPSRAGILNVWRYYDEVFTFHDGRLLLRGPNGSGKSKALELLLPYLFDANLRAGRLSTFGTGERTMHWNLMGEGASGTTRVGYVWLEFTKQGETTTRFTCGARLQASTHTTTVSADYFTTDLSIEPGEMTLLNDSGAPLTRAALDERLGERGTVHPNATAYRTALRSVLFPGLNEQRYDALITALLQLRTPKLSQRLDPALLSTLLSRALPPLDPQEITDLAEGFERLDAQRERLRTLEAEVDATRGLARRQRTYAQRVLRAGAGQLTTAASELDTLSRRARDSEQEYQLALTRDEELNHQIDRLTGEVRRAEAAREALTEKDAYKSGLELDRLRRRTESALYDARRLEGVAARDEERAQGDAQALEEAQEDEQRAAAATGRAVDELRQSAVRVGLVAVTDDALSRPAAERREARALLRASGRSREEQIEQIVACLQVHERAIERREDAEGELDVARAALEETQRASAAASAQYELVFADLSSELLDWAGSCRELIFPDLTALPEYADSETELLALLTELATAVTSELAAQRTTAQAGLDELTATQSELESELRHVIDHRDLPPVASPYRTTDRGSLAGAPLWQLIDFADSVPPDVRAPLEAALEASGLLDAWVTPAGEAWIHNGDHGRWIGPDRHDTFASADGLPPVRHRSLADLLIPEPGSVVSADVVRRLLAVVAVDSYGAAIEDGRRDPILVGLDGSWRMGVLSGSWAKDEAAHIGTAARQRARDRHAAELRARLTAVATGIETRRATVEALARRREVLDADLAARPSYETVGEAGDTLRRRQADVAAAESVVRDRLSAVTLSESRVSTALRDLSLQAAEAGLPTERSALTGLTSGLRSFAELTEAWMDEQRHLEAARSSAGEGRRRADRSAQDARERVEEATEAAAAHESLQTQLTTIEETVGLDYRAVLDEIKQLRGRLEQLAADQASAREEKTALARRIGELSSRHAAEAAARDKASTSRDLIAHRFRWLSSGTFPLDSELPDLAGFHGLVAGSEGVRATLDAARLVTGVWPDLPHAPNHLADAVRRLSESVHECRETLRTRADLDLEADQDVQVFTAVIDGLRVGAAELLRRLKSDADTSRAEITDRERELFDRTLTGATRRHLAARIRQANQLVDQMNLRLDQVRTASKVAVQLAWQPIPDLNAGTRTARDLLLKDPVTLSGEDRDSLHRFLRDRVEQARADDTAATWAEQLAHVFDYTAWHHFVVKVDRGKGDGYQTLTRKLHGALSGGEKAIALHLPLFAVVAAHYQTVPDAPRVILLDEVFVGVDSTNRGQVFALLTALDLDLVLTSDHEWCTYAELPGIGIHQLVTATDGYGDGDDAVTTARFTWNGHELTGDIPR